MKSPSDSPYHYHRHRSEEQDTYKKTAGRTRSRSRSRSLSHADRVRRFSNDRIRRRSSSYDGQSGTRSFSSRKARSNNRESRSTDSHSSDSSLSEPKQRYRDSHCRTNAYKQYSKPHDVCTDDSDASSSDSHLKQKNEQGGSGNSESKKTSQRKDARQNKDLASSRMGSSHKLKKSKHNEKESGKTKEKLAESKASTSDKGEWIIEKLKQLHEEKLRKKEVKRKAREVMKQMEAPEEKRLRRLLKKEAKERKRKERMGWDKDYMHYTNTDNPFGDANLLETFVWHRKFNKDGLSNVNPEELERQNKLKQEENRVELEKVKKRRLEREQERAQREEEMQRLQRQKEAAQFKEWEKQEDIFHLQQALLRSKIRIEDGRAKPIDLLAKYISTEDEDLAVEMHEPYTYLNGLTIRDLEDLLEDIKVYMELEKGKNLDYWNDITIIVEDELYKLRKVDAANRERFGDRREGINASVSSEVLSVFKGKTHNQLLALHDQIMKKITNGEEGIDIGYWESLLSQLKAQMARARLRDRHQENLRRKLFQLKQEQGVESEPVFPIVEESSSKSRAEESDHFARPSTPQPRSYEESTSAFLTRPSITEVKEPKEESTEDRENDTVLTEEDLRDHSMEEYESGCYSPRLLKSEELEPGTLLIDEYDDSRRLEFARQQLVGTGSIQAALSTEERAFEMEARVGMTDDEAMFSVESPLDHRMYLWSDKYRPRKPRYFNRVHTGFEWNKYNQTHYDMDNPPPKIVQGYKFNIFYPDLIDKSATPEYTLTPCPDNKDFAILRFRAGPPYEDIAFKIVNREWEYSYKRGFRCQFHNNIFQLWFHFKRYRYRR